MYGCDPQLNLKKKKKKKKTMTDQAAGGEHRAGRCLMHNWAEERAVADLDNDKKQIQRHGHRGILTLDHGAKMESTTTVTTAYVDPKHPGVRTRGIRGELLEKDIARMIREEMEAERSRPAPPTEYHSTTQRDFSGQGFVPLPPQSTQTPGRDYKTEQAVTFWSENYQQIQGVTSAQTLKAPFRKSALFSTPVDQRLDEPELPPDDV